MSLIKGFDKKYSLPGLLGFQKENKRTKETLIIHAEKNPIANIKHDIDYNISLHTKQIQRSEFVKIDDNILNFQFNNRIFGSGKRKFTDDEI